ncbi:PQQ-binding-like beta-propeller repeat protein [Phytoactinopolyspora endophytica]|uniref:outer membrane protein assembly factor BamB family protein n=1 Tax=Phytoactinopolyspora endophytica TaxID=1642495 RepID=UPI0013EAF7F3|nr:PQQ-binding-like beta-propeller repeat protein [Phytoactinopolyspora endophytica]
MASVKVLSEHDNGITWVSGRVLNDDGGSRRGLPGVAVSDGDNVTQTESDGSYRLPVARTRRHRAVVFVTVPAGWQAPPDERGNPAFFRHVDLARTGSVDNVDFVLRPDPAPTDDYRFVTMADVHVQADGINTKDGLSSQLRQINSYIRESRNDSGPAMFVLVAGDLTNYATEEEFDDYLAAITASDIPVWSIPGNHDLTARVPGGPYPKQSPATQYRDVIANYRKKIGPEWYSFQYGRQHFVVLENYRGLGEPDQLRWLTRDLEINAAGKQIVVVSHVPWNVPQTPSPDLTAPYLELFARYDVRLLLAGHTHSNDVDPALVDGAVQVVTTSSSFTKDLSPRGFRMVEFHEGHLTTPFVELDADRELTVVHPAGDVARAPSAVHVNRYSPPGLATEARYRIPPHGWRPLSRTGDRMWVGQIDPEHITPRTTQRIDVQLRDDAASPWMQKAATFTVAGTPQTTPRQGTPWPMFHRDARHSGRGTDDVRPPLDLAWVRHSGGTILTSSPAVDHDTVFIGVRDENAATNSGVFAVDLGTGEPRWHSRTVGQVASSVAVDGDVVLAACARGPLLAMDVTDGRVRWEWTPEHPEEPDCWMYFSPTVADGAVYQAYNVASGVWVVSLDTQTGKQRWRSEKPIGRNWMSHGSPAVADGSLYVVTAYGNLAALDLDSGAVRWQAAFGGGIVVGSSPVVDGGLVLLACHGDRLVAVDPADGEARWSYQAPGPSRWPGRSTAATPAVSDGVVYAAFSDGSVTALTIETGEPLWHHHTDGAILSSPAVSGGRLYVGSNDGHIRAIDRDDGRCTWSHNLGTWVASSPAATGNTVVAAAWDGAVYAFVSAEGPP